MKNFIKLIKQAHEEKFSAVTRKLLVSKMPVAFLLTAPIAQAVKTVSDFRAQGLNVTTLITVDNPRQDLDIEIFHVNDAARMYPQPEYIFVTELIEARVALKYFPASKVLMFKDSADEIYETFMRHLDDLQEVYESLIDEESKKTFRGYWLGKISNQLGKIVYSNSRHYLIRDFIPESGAIVIDAGVYDGGTATIFSEMGYKVYGFEMDAKNYERSIKVAKQKNFVVENFGLGAYNHSAHYDLTGLKTVNKNLDKGVQNCTEV